MIIDEQIVLAMVAAASTGQPAGIPDAELDRCEDVVLDEQTPKRSTFAPFEDEESPFGEFDASPVQGHEMIVAVRQFALGTKTTAPFQEANKIHAWNVKALTDQRFGNLANYCKPIKRRWMRPDKPVDRKQIELVTLWLVRFQSKSTDAELRA